SNITYTAKASDVTKPTVSLNPNTQTTYVSGGKAVTVNLADSGSGLKANQPIYYAWSTSNTTAPTSWSSVTSTNVAGAKSASVTVPATSNSSLTGTYYLWIKAGTLSDVSGNTSNQVVSALFKFDNTNPTISLSTSKTTKSITAVATASALSGISKYEFSKDNGATWVANGTSNTYTFTGLTHKTAYNIKSRVTSGVGRQTSSATVATTTNTIPTPTYSASYASGKTTVTITYPSGCGSSYTCSYIKDGGTAVNVTSTTAAVAFTASGNVVAKVSDGTNTITASTYSTVVKYAITTSKNSTVNLTVTPNTTLTTSGTSVTFTVPSSSSYTYQGAYVYNSSGTKVMTLNASTRSFTMPAYAVRIAPIFKHNDLTVMKQGTRNTTFKYKSISEASYDGAKDLIFYETYTDYKVLSLISYSSNWWQFGLAYSSTTYDLSLYSKLIVNNNADVSVAGSGNHGYFGVFKSLDEGMYFSSTSKFVERKNVNATELDTEIDLSSFANDRTKYYIGIEYSTSYSSTNLFIWGISLLGRTFYS
ncbi:MAG: hypothetical protein ACLR92_04900, partial [Bacilli bacterium]